MANMPANSIQMLSGGNIVKEGDQTPFAFQFNDEKGEIVSLDGATVNYKLANESIVLVNRPATVVDDTVEIKLTADDVTGIGNMRLEFKVTHGNGTIEKFPANGWQELEITRSLDTVDNGVVAVVTLEEFEERINTAITNAETATADVTQAVDSANTAATNANKSATNADDAADRANTSADNADTATTNANTATDNATQATADANTATTNANDAASNANTAADNANLAARQTIGAYMTEENESWVV